MNKRGKSTAPPFDLGNPVPLSNPCPDQRWFVSAQCLLRDESGEDQCTDQGFQRFHVGASMLPILSTRLRASDQRVFPRSSRMNVFIPRCI
jgi:hypothetical protein